MRSIASACSACGDYLSEKPIAGSFEVARSGSAGLGGGMDAICVSAFYRYDFALARGARLCLGFVVQRRRRHPFTTIGPSPGVSSVFLVVRSGPGTLVGLAGPAGIGIAHLSRAFMAGCTLVSNPAAGTA